MDQEVAKTLGELELKLQELERELTSIGRRDSRAEWPRTPGKLIDEAVERELEPNAPPPAPPPHEHPPPAPPPHEHPPHEHRSIEVADLVRFKETMQRTLQGLVDEYSRLLSLEPPPDA